jgi:hypothetical protein
MKLELKEVAVFMLEVEVPDLAGILAREWWCVGRVSLLERWLVRPRKRAEHFGAKSRSRDSAYPCHSSHQSLIITVRAIALGFTAASAFAGEQGLPEQ